MSEKKVPTGTGVSRLVDDNFRPADIDLHYRMFWDNMVDGMFLHPVSDGGAAGCFLLVNTSACQTLGYTETELLRMSPYDLDDPDLSSGYVQQATDLLLREGSVVFEAVHRHKDGSRLAVEICAQKVQVGVRSCVLSLARYRANRMRSAIGEFVQSNTRLRLMMETAHVGSWEWDALTDTHIWSDELWRMFGLEPHFGHASYEIWQNSVIPEDRERVEHIVKSSREQGVAFTVEWRVSDGKGGYSWLMTKATPLMRADGRVSRYIGMVLDITPQKRAEEQNFLLMQEMHETGKMQLLGRLAGGIAHDFNNMLAVIQGNAEIALGRLDPDQEIYGEIDTIRETALRSANLTRQLLAFAQKQSVKPQLFEINRAVEGMIKMLKPLVGAQIAVRWNPGMRDYPVCLDPSQLDQIVMNLCVNARDAITGAGTISLTTSHKCIDEHESGPAFSVQHGCYVVLSVTDDGSGISETNLPHIIEPYFTTKTPDKGSGLGLSTVYGIVRQNQGFICCRSEVGKGTTFDIYLPLHETFPHHDEDASELSRTHRSCSAQRTILLVDDDSAILKLCRKVLEQSGFNILEASCPLEALRIAESFQGEIHLLLSDVVMPEMSGFELFEKLVVKRSGIRSLFMSGYTDGSFEGYAVQDRAMAFLRKPFTLHALQSNVQKMF